MTGQVRASHRFAPSNRVGERAAASRRGDGAELRAHAELAQEACTCVRTVASDTTQLREIPACGPARGSAVVSRSLAIRSGACTGLKNLIAAIETYIDAWNVRCQPLALD